MKIKYTEDGYVREYNGYDDPGMTMFLLLIAATWLILQGLFIAMGIVGIIELSDSTLIAGDFQGGAIAMVVLGSIFGILPFFKRYIRSIFFKKPKQN